MFHLTIHNQLFSLSVDDDFAGAGGGEKWSAQGLDIHQGNDCTQAHTSQEQHDEI